MKNKKYQIEKIFGRSGNPAAHTKMRQKQMQHIQSFIMERFYLENEVTPGKINASGRLIKKPNWEYGVLTYEPNIDAMVHEIAHLCLAPLHMGLSDHDNEMRRQFGEVNSKYGYMKQKRSQYEIQPMALENPLRRRLGLPVSTKPMQVESHATPRIAVDTNTPCAVRIKKNSKTLDLLRVSSNMNAVTRRRLELIDLGIIEYDALTGWEWSQSIDAKINRRALSKGCKV